ncbi:MAG: hypothetical protein AB7L84_11540 [Acidimicrobiia bacterium]
MDTIRGHVGANGGGKTLAMVETIAIPAWEREIPVVANFRLRPESLGYDPDLYRPLESWRQIADLRGCRLLLDEISRVAPSRSSASMPAQLIGTLEQLRKARVIVGWSAPSWKRCDVVLRDVTQSVTVCRGFLPDPWRRRPGVRRFPRRARDEHGRPVRYGGDEWPPNRLLRWTTYDAQEWDEFTMAGAREAKPIRRVRYWRTLGRAQAAYDTLEAVDLLDHLDDVGVCVACGGTRTRAKCTCPRERHGGVEPAQAAERRSGPPGREGPRLGQSQPKGPRARQEA